MAQTEAQKKASKKYHEEKCDEIKLRVKKGRKAEIQEWAAAKGKSVNLYIIDLINKDMGGPDSGENS